LKNWIFLPNYANSKKLPYKERIFLNLVGGLCGSSTLRLQNFISLATGSTELQAFMC